jgi:hypothetical protein
MACTRRAWCATSVGRRTAAPEAAIGQIGQMSGGCGVQWFVCSAGRQGRLRLRQLVPCGVRLPLGERGERGRVGWELPHTPDAMRVACFGAHADGGRYGPGSPEYSRVLYYTHALAHRHARRHRRVHARTRVVRCVNDGGFGSASPAGGARGRAADTSPGTRRASAQRKSRAHPRRPDLHTEQTGPRRPYLTRSAALLPCCNTGAARAVVGAALT